MLRVTGQSTLLSANVKSADLKQAPELSCASSGLIVSAQNAKIRDLHADANDEYGGAISQLTSRPARPKITLRHFNDRLILNILPVLSRPAGASLREGMRYDLMERARGSIESTQRADLRPKSLTRTVTLDLICKSRSRRW